MYIDSQIYEDEVHIFANWEVFLQILDGNIASISKIGIIIDQGFITIGGPHLI